MWVIIVIALIYFISWLYTRYANKDISSNSYSSNRSSPSQPSVTSKSREVENKYSFSRNFSVGSGSNSNRKLDVVMDAVRIENQNYIVFKATFNGVINSYYSRTPVIFRLNIFDHRKGKRNFIFCSMKELQYSDSPVFLYVSNPIPLPYSSTQIRDYNFVSVPLDILTFPYKGRTTLEFELEIIKSINDITKVSVGYNFTNDKDGYFDVIENKQKSQKLLIELGVILAAIDGDIDPNELNVINKWINKITKKPDETDFELRKELKNYLNGKSSVSSIEATYENVKRICREINKVADLSFKYELMEVIIDLISSDLNYDKQEKIVIQMIADQFNLDMDKFRNMFQKKMPTELLQQDESNDVLGLSSSMTNEEKRRHLRKEYERWSNRVTNSDPAIRKKAEEMLEMIAKERANLRE